MLFLSETREKILPEDKTVPGLDRPQITEEEREKSENSSPSYDLSAGRLQHETWTLFLHFLFPWTQVT